MLIFTGQIYVTGNKGNILNLMRRIFDSTYMQILNSSDEDFRRISMRPFNQSLIKL